MKEVKVKEVTLQADLGAEGYDISFKANYTELEKNFEHKNEVIDIVSRNNLLLNVDDKGYIYPYNVEDISMKDVINGFVMNFKIICGDFHLVDNKKELTKELI